MVTITDTLQNPFYKYFTFLHNIHIILRIFMMSNKVANSFLICITLFVIVLFLISIINVEELGMGYIRIIIFSVFRLLALACVITICDID